MNNMTLALRIRQIRERSNYTQEQTASHLGISRQAYVRLEQGKRTISFIDIKKLSRLFDINYTEITDIDEQNNLSLIALCRDENRSLETEGAFKTIEELLGVLTAQEKLFYRKKEQGVDSND